MLLLVSVKKEKPEWRFAAERIFLTYSHVLPRFTPKIVLVNLRKIVGKREILQYLISVEEYSKGGLHIHVYLKVEPQFDTTNVRFMDIIYYGKIYHPNIAVVTAWHQLMKYIKKDGNWISNINETRPIWKTMVEDSVNKKEFIENMIFHFGTENQYLTYRLMHDLWKETRVLGPKTDGRNASRRFKYRD